MLVGNLGPNSALVNVLAAQKRPKIDPRTGEQIIEISDPKQIDALFRGMARESQREPKTRRQRRD